MAQVTTVYDGRQHCTAGNTAKGKPAAMVCPHTGKG